MTGSTITTVEFEERLAAICGGGGGSGFPRRERDVIVILASMTLWMDHGALYTETEINEGLDRWRVEVCPSLDLDSVTLRRELVDRNFLTRNDSGSSYAPGPGPAGWRFEGIAGVDPAAVMRQAAAEREDRKRAWATRQSDGGS